MTTWFTADTHFGHGATLGRFRRPFATLQAMDDAMVERWNARVGPADEVWHLGDFAYRLDAGRAGALLERLNGVKHLITGNNDGPATTDLAGWASVRAYAEIAVDEVALVLCHYPFRTWNGMYKRAWNLHGHSHGALAGLTRQVDVGVDVWEFRPISLTELTAPRRRARRHPGEPEPKSGP